MSEFQMGWDSMNRAFIKMLTFWTMGSNEKRAQKKKESKGLFANKRIM